MRVGEEGNEYNVSAWVATSLLAPSAQKFLGWENLSEHC